MVLPFLNKFENTKIRRRATKLQKDSVCAQAEEATPIMAFPFN
jgi:hypothetical protein